MKIYIMKKNRHLLTVVLRGFVGPSITRARSRGVGSRSRLPTARDSSYVNSGCTVQVNCGAARGQGFSERMMKLRPAEATEVEETSTL